MSEAVFTIRNLSKVYRTGNVEVKALREVHPVHKAQMLSYLRLAGLSVGLLLNFNTAHLRDGITRLVR